MSLFSVRQSTDGFDISDVIKGEYEEAGIEFDKHPTCRIQVPNESGIELHRLFVGKDIQVRRAGVLDFTGIIDIPEGTQGDDLSVVEFEATHKGYAQVSALKCTNYDYDEDGDPVTTRDGVTVNPWNYFIFRTPDGALDARGETPAVDGIPFDTAMRSFIGTRCIHQIDFQDNSYFRASQIYATTNTIQIYRDGAASQKRPALQRARNGATFKTGIAIESIPLQNGDQNVSIMGDVSTVSVLFIGKRDAGSNDITIDVCRNAKAGSRTYTAVTLAFTSNYLSSGLDAWSGTVDLSADGAAAKNALGFRINIAGGATSTTTYLYYAKLVANTVTDCGITEGTIDPYSNPFTISGAENWVDADFQGMGRDQAIETARKQTASDPANNPNPHWDAWMDGNLTFHFKERRGAVIAKTYSFPEGTLREVAHEYYGKKIRFQTIAYGPGSGNSQTRIVSKAAFSAGGLYDADRDWTVNPSTAIYGKRAGIGDFVDANERSLVSLLRKAYADHKLHRVPVEKVRVEITAEYIAYFATGDSITIDNLNTRTSGAIRVVHIKRAWDGKRREQLTVTLGEPIVDVTDRMLSTRQKADTLTYHVVPQDIEAGLSGNGFFFDKDHFGMYTLMVREGVLVDKVFLRLGTQPWQIGAKATKASSPTSAASSVGESTNPGYISRDYSAGTTSPTIGSPYYVYAQAPAPTNGVLSGYITDLRIFNTQSSAQNMTYRLRNMTQGTVLTGPTTLTSVPAFSWSAPSFSWTTAQVAQGDSLRLEIYDCIIGSASPQINQDILLWVRAETDHTHTVTVQPAIEFGIFQFNSDSDNTGTLAPTYGTNIKISVDPAVDAATGLPSQAQFDAAKLPNVMGSSQTVPEDIDVEITGWLATESNGIIKTGPHKIFFLGTADSTVRANSKGLTVVSVNPDFKFKRSGV